jgi:hypothetical protein
MPSILEEVNEIPPATIHSRSDHRFCGNVESQPALPASPSNSPEFGEFSDFHRHNTQDTTHIYTPF